MSEVPPACPFCAETIDASTTQCPHCGEQLEAPTEPCPFCAEAVDVGASVCPHCHESLGGRPGSTAPAAGSGLAALRTKPTAIFAGVAAIALIVGAVVILGGGGDRDDDDSSGGSARATVPESTTTTTTTPTFTNPAVATLLAHIPADLRGTCDDFTDADQVANLICNRGEFLVNYEQYADALEMNDFFDFIAEEYGARAAGPPATPDACPFEASGVAGRIACYMDDDGSISVDYTDDSLLIYISVSPGDATDANDVAEALKVAEASRPI